MGAVRRIEVTGPAPTPVSWARYAELSQWSSWAPQIAGVEAPSGELRPGLTGSVRTSVGIHVPFVVTDVDPVAHTWSWIARLGPVRLTLHHGLVPEDSGTRATLAIEGPALVVTAYAPLAASALRNLVR